MEDYKILWAQTELKKEASNLVFEYQDIFLGTNPGCMQKRVQAAVEAEAGDAANAAIVP